MLPYACFPSVRAYGARHGYCGRRCWAIRGFGQDLAMDAVAVFESNLIFEGSRDKNIAGYVPNRIGTWKRTRPRKILDRAGFFPEFVQFFDRQSVRVIYSGIPLADANHFAPIFFGKEFRGVVADVSKSLEYDRFALHAWRQSQFLQVFGILKSFPDSVLDTTASGFAAPMNTSLANRFAGDTSKIIDPSRVKGVVC